jgi:hypothetical protein
MVLEHLVVAKAARADKLEQATLDDILRYGAQELFAEEEDDDNAAAGSDAVAAAGADGTAAQQQEDGLAHQQQQKQSGGSKAKLRIVWDDEALHRLLDRSQLTAQPADAEAAEDEDDDFSKAFKVCVWGWCVGVWVFTVCVGVWVFTGCVGVWVLNNVCGCVGLD